MTSVFASRRDEVFARYRAELTFRDKLMAGVPKDPKVIEAWLRSKAGVDSEIELRRMLVRTLREQGVDAPEDATLDDLIAASESIAGQGGCGFKQNGAGLYIESRQVKAMIKESVNVLFAGEKGWGKSGKKGPKNVVAETVFVEPLCIALGRDTADGVYLSIGHFTGPRGPQSTLTYHEYAEKAIVGFDVLVAEDVLIPEQWVRIWIHAEANGLGALRSQSFGTFAVTAWERIS